MLARLHAVRATRSMIFKVSLLGLPPSIWRAVFSVGTTAPLNGEEISSSDRADNPPTRQLIHAEIAAILQLAPWVAMSACPHYGPCSDLTDQKWLQPPVPKTIGFPSMPRTMTTGAPARKAPMRV